MTASVWGVKASLLEYLADLGDATTTCTDGAEPLPDGRFRWPAAPTADGFDGSGTVRFEAYGGTLDVRLAAPRLVVSGGRAGLTVGASEITTGTATDDSGEVRPDRVDTYRAAFTSKGIDPEAVRLMFETPGPVLDEALDRIEQRHGSVRAYLEAHGLEDADVERLRAALLEDPR